jgi:hypothetical protein
MVTSVRQVKKQELIAERTLLKCMINNLENFTGCDVHLLFIKMHRYEANHSTKTTLN